MLLLGDQRRQALNSWSFVHLQYLSVIGQKFYGLQPPRNGLSSLLEMFSGGM